MTREQIAAVEARWGDGDVPLSDTLISAETFDDYVFSLCLKKIMKLSWSKTAFSGEDLVVKAWFKTTNALAKRGTGDAVTKKILSDLLDDVCRTVFFDALKGKAYGRAAYPLELDEDFIIRVDTKHTNLGPLGSPRIEDMDDLLNNFEVSGKLRAALAWSCCTGNRMSETARTMGVNPSSMRVAVHKHKIKHAKTQARKRR